jgi:hypothetical protein
VSRFYLSLEDNLMRIFASDRVKNFMQALGMEKGEAIEHRMVTNAIEKASARSRGATSTSASSCSSTMMSPTISARSSTSSATTCSKKRHQRNHQQRSAATW